MDMNNNTTKIIITSTYILLDAVNLSELVLLFQLLLFIEYYE